MSKLFHSRRIRFGARNDAADAEPDSSPASYRRATTHRRHHHRNNRHDLGGCNPTSRRILLSEYEHSVSQPQSGSIINSEDFRSIRRFGATGNDRLPGVVLLARERLVERLRGVHIAQNRSIHQDAIQYSSVIEETSNNDNNNNTNNDNNNLAMRPPGLCKDELNGLSKKVFEEKKEFARGTRECSICLEGFEDGNEVIELACMHRFHSCCLFPWIEVCGACPNCRKDIVV